MSYPDSRRARYTVETDGDMVIITVARWEAMVIARILRAVSGPYFKSRLERHRTRGIAARIIHKTRPKRDLRMEPWYLSNYKVARPPSSTTSEFDRDHVLNGYAPYPVLSVPDMEEVYPLLEARGMSAEAIADRLHVVSRTVVRWRGKTRQGRGKRQSDQTQAHG